MDSGLRTTPYGPPTALVIPRLSCVYCGVRIVKVYDRAEGHWYWPSKLACVKHAYLVKLDPRYQRA